MAANKLGGPTYEQVRALKTATTVPATDRLRPDTPYTEGAIEPYGDKGHVNPAINPASGPIVAPPHVPVPVVNDPGVLGNAPSLAELNAAARASYGVPETDATSGITEASNQAEIKQAAMARLKDLQAEIDSAGDEPAPVPAARTAKVGSASKA
jgi:hypothetical protein